MLKVIEEDLTQVGDFTKRVFLNSGGVYAVSMLPDFTNNMDGMVQRNLARGFAWYLADEIATELLTGSSNFRNFTDMKNLPVGLKNAVDNSVFYGLASATIEQTRVDVPVVQTINSVVNNPTVSENLGIGLLLTTSQMVGQHLERAGYEGITKITKKLGW